MTPSYAHGVASKPLLGQTLAEALEETVSKYGSNEALVSVFEARRLTYAQFGNEVERVARALLALGIQKNDRVAVWSTNCVAWVLLQFATAKVGAILVTINPAYRLHELEFALQQSESHYLVAGERFKDADYAAMLRQLIPELDTNRAEKKLGSAKFPNLRCIVYLGEQPQPGMLRWQDFDAGVDRISLPSLRQREEELDFDDVVNIQYTSGTTGFPKGAMLTHHNILNNGFWIGERMRLGPNDRLCIPVPFYHCFGMVLGNLACVTHGTTMVLPAPHFSPLHTLEAVARERCTALHGVPSMFIAELDNPHFRDFDLSTLRTGIMAGAPCPVEVMKRVLSDMHCREITIACGMTETSPVCNMTEADDPLEVRVSTVGKVMPHQEQKIVDPITGRTLPWGTPGELCCRGYQIMRGYYNDPRATDDMIDSAGWLHSGDMAAMDHQGYIRITGRLKDMICRGGEKIFPREVEEFLFQHPDIAEVSVIGVPDAYYGEQVMAWIKLKSGRTLSAPAVQDFCRGQIMDYKVPRYVKFVDDFPKTVTGKIQKFRMRQISSEELGLSSGRKLAA